MWNHASNQYAHVGQDDGIPPRLRAYTEHAKTFATSMPSFYMWILDADGRERALPFSAADKMFAALRRKNHNFYYAVLFDKTGPTWPEPVTSLYGCHSPEWTTWPSEFPQPQVACPSTNVGAGVLPSVAQAAHRSPLIAAVISEFKRGHFRDPVSWQELLDFLMWYTMELYGEAGLTPGR